MLHCHFSKSKIHEPKTMKSVAWMMFGNWRKKLHKISQISPRFFREIGEFEKYVQIFVQIFVQISNFKTPRNSLNALGFASQFQLYSPLDVGKSEEVVLLVFEPLHTILCDSTCYTTEFDDREINGQQKQKKTRQVNPQMLI